MARIEIRCELLVDVLSHPSFDVAGVGRALLFPQDPVLDAVDIGDRPAGHGRIVDNVVSTPFQPCRLARCGIAVGGFLVGFAPEAEEGGVAVGLVIRSRGFGGLAALWARLWIVLLAGR